MVGRGEAFVGPGVGKEDFGTMVEAEVAPMVQLGAQDAAFIVHNAIYMAQMARPGRGLQRGGPPVPVGCVHRFRFGPAAVDGINDFQMFSPTCGIGDFKMQGFHGMVCLRSCSPRVHNIYYMGILSGWGCLPIGGIPLNGGKCRKIWRFAANHLIKTAKILFGLKKMRTKLWVKWGCTYICITIQAVPVRLGYSSIIT